MKKSNLGNLGSSDFIKGLITAVLTAFCTSLLQVLNNGGLPTAADLKFSGIAATAAFLGYLLKNLGTNSDDKFLKKENSPVMGTTNPGDDKPRPPKPGGN